MDDELHPSPQEFVRIMRYAEELADSLSNDKCESRHWESMCDWSESMLRDSICLGIPAFFANIERRFVQSEHLIAILPFWGWPRTAIDGYYEVTREVLLWRKRHGDTRMPKVTASKVIADAEAVRAAAEEMKAVLDKAASVGRGSLAGVHSSNANRRVVSDKKQKKWQREAAELGKQFPSKKGNKRWLARMIHERHSAPDDQFYGTSEAIRKKL